MRNKAAVTESDTPKLAAPPCPFAIKRDGTEIYSLAALGLHASRANMPITQDEQAHATGGPGGRTARAFRPDNRGFASADLAGVAL